VLYVIGARVRYWHERAEGQRRERFEGRQRVRAKREIYWYKRDEREREILARES